MSVAGHLHTVHARLFEIIVTDLSVGRVLAWTQTILSLCKTSNVGYNNVIVRLFCEQN